MTKDIVQSDIDLARRLLDTHRPTAEILTALLRRGISQPVALRLIEDLQVGRTVAPRLPLPERPPTGAESISEATGPGTPATEVEAPFGFPPAPKAKVPGRVSRVVFLGVLSLSVLLGGAYYFYHLQSHTLLMRLLRASDDLAIATPADQKVKLEAAAQVLQGLQARILNSRERIVVQRIASQLEALAPGPSTNTISK